MTNAPGKTPSTFSANPPAGGGPLPRFRTLLENGKVSRWRVSLGFLLHGLAVAVLFLLPLLMIEPLNPEPLLSRTPIIDPSAGKTNRDSTAKRPTGYKPNRPIIDTIDTIRYHPPQVPTPGSDGAAPVIEAGFGGSDIRNDAPVGNGNGTGSSFWPWDGNAPIASPPAPTASPEPVRPGGKVKPPRLIHRVEPDYPIAARQMRLEGRVVLEALLGVDGRVQQIEVKSGPPLLAQAARRAVEQWTYEPTYLNGQPVPLLLNVTVEFRLNR